MKGRELRDKLFEKFSQNLNQVKAHPQTNFNPDFSGNMYVCPICFNIFSRDDLNINAQNHLTLEDVPPKSLGGRPIVLTCKNCNSKSGHSLDAHLLKALEQSSFKRLLPNTKSRVKFELNQNRVNGIIEVYEGKTMKIDFRKDWSEPKQADQFIKDIDPNNNIIEREEINFSFQTPTFTITPTPPFRVNERTAKVNLLRIGYLLAFAKFGYGFLMNDSLHNIRNQIRNPDQSIINGFWIKYNFPDDTLGINLISNPKELMSFLMVFKLKTKSFSKNFGIVLPGPSDPGIKIYENINNIFSKGNGIKLGLKHIIDRDFFSSESLTFASHVYWQIYKKRNYYS